LPAWLEHLPAACFHRLAAMRRQLADPLCRLCNFQRRPPRHRVPSFAHHQAADVLERIQSLGAPPDQDAQIISMHFDQDRRAIAAFMLLELSTI
jgi:hypothetical protein